MPRPRPGSVMLTGTTVRLEPLDWAAHEQGLFAVVGGKENARLWDHVSVGPYVDQATFQNDLEQTRVARGWEAMVIHDSVSNVILGMFSFMRIREQHGSVEIGCVVFGYTLQRTSKATEGLLLMARHVFDDLGYRRYEWKCDDQNKASVRAAKRFGFLYEGTFRNDSVSKGRNRDTAWFSITDGEWPSVRAGLDAWLTPQNFDADGTQIKTLEEVRGPR
ncbi:MAG: GNAT family N-acetyltransferase [Rhodospirillaceae bacterium]|nr:GNAT family N-acetyltransferase [Rhodospirillaceae bacterium]MBT5241602.1 GNAT family N-acetyltransferase [Rhodospirillaceae bacterium]MBT5567371.1 GNAT family N-acetyltransferase [Rhodospirillaceae bacterium]MBT6089689.1 GNAT family N-acetyltransferase [Rhodospirillaceae bacterium]MBT7449617.1 GNAT family N-acetyltransferase [Rhodospirillaceae bacterium]